MKKELSEKTQEIIKLEEALTTLHEELTFLESQDVQSVAKDLAKKNRDLNVSLQRERKKNASLKIEMQKLQQELQAYEHYHVSPKKMVEPMGFSKKTSTIEKPPNNHKNSMTTTILPSIKNNNNNNNDTINTQQYDISDDINNNEQPIDFENEINNWKDKYDNMRQKYLECKNTLRQTKDENMKLQLALRREIGDDTPFTEILKNGGTWKGRAENIALLKMKLSDYKAKINQMQGNEDYLKNPDQKYKYKLAYDSVQRAEVMFHICFAFVCFCFYFLLQMNTLYCIH